MEGSTRDMDINGAWVTSCKVTGGSDIRCKCCKSRFCYFPRDRNFDHSPFNFCPQLWAALMMVGSGERILSNTWSQLNPHSCHIGRSSHPSVNGVYLSWCWRLATMEEKRYDLNDLILFHDFCVHASRTCSSSSFNSKILWCVGPWRKLSPVNSSMYSSFYNDLRLKSDIA